MPYYVSAGVIPHKRHTQFHKANGELHSEQLFSTEGFSNDSSLLYHLYPPTVITSTDIPFDVKPELDPLVLLQHRSFAGFMIKSCRDFLESRQPILINKDCHISLASPLQSMEQYFYKNADADELIFVHEGSGFIMTQYGKLDFRYGDYIVIPRGTIYQIHFDGSDRNGDAGSDPSINRFLIVESFSPIRFPKRYVSKNGQLLENSPYCERDLRIPIFNGAIDQQGDFLIKVKKQGMRYGLHYASHPFDVVGWDGCNYPFILSIHDFEPITGRVHQPPPVHQTFEAGNFVVCSFVPRLFDYHPQAIPAPYNHSNIDSDEVLYYVDGDFMSRRNVTRGMITLHPSGIPHGPHPGTVEKSIGVKETKELAVMIDTFHPLQLTKQAISIENPDYVKSWMH